MSVNRHHRLPADDLQTARTALIGVQSLADYAPFNRAYATTRLIELGQAMEDARQAEVRAVQALAAARATAHAAEWALHEGILGARAQVIAQYGPDSSAMQLLGLKKKSERRSARRRTAALAQ